MDQLYHLQDYGGLKLLYITPEKFCRRWVLVCICVFVIFAAISGLKDRRYGWKTTMENLESPYFSTRTVNGKPGSVARSLPRLPP